MAKQAGFVIHTHKPSLITVENEETWVCVNKELEAFAKLVEAHIRGQIFKPDWDNYRQGLIDGAVSEREACAQVAFSWNTAMTDKVAKEIQARGEA